MSYIKTEISTDLPTFMANLKLNKDKVKVVVLDTESSTSRLVWDFAYAYTNPFTRFRGAPKGKLVYEALKDKFLIDEISQWNKVRYAKSNEAYHLINQLEKEEWFSSSHSKEDIKTIKNNLLQTVAEKEYENIRQVSLLSEDIRHRGDWWKPGIRRTFDPSKETDRLYRESIEREEGADKALTILEQFVKYGDNVEDIIKNNILAKSEFALAFRYNRIYYNWFTQQKNMQPNQQEQELDLAKMSQLLGGKEEVASWDTIMKDFSKDITQNKNDILAVTAYNLSSDIGFMDQTSRIYGFPEHQNILDGFDIICMRSMYSQLSRMEPEKIADAMAGMSPKSIKEGYKKALKTIGSKVETRFSVAYKTQLNLSEFSQSHTAKGDVQDESLFMESLVEMLTREFGQSK